MERQVAWAAGKPGSEDLLLSFQSDTEAYYGRLVKARDFSRRAVDSAVRDDSKEPAALWQANAALREAEFGNAAAAKQDVGAALALAPGRDVKLLAALALARIGETTPAKAIVDELEKNYGSNTILKVYWLPTIKAAMELNANNSTQAVVFLEAAGPYELGGPPQLQVPTMYPVYIRGQAQLMAHNGAAAAIEFQKFLDHRGVTINFPLGALAHLQIGRAYVMQADTAKRGFPRIMERCRPRHSHTHRRESGVRQAALKPPFLNSSAWTFNGFGSDGTAIPGGERFSQ
jgi:hypothetical protein